MTRQQAIERLIKRILNYNILIDKYKNVNNQTEVNRCLKEQKSLIDMKDKMVKESCYKLTEH